MMLNTDMCLAFANNDGQPVVAARDECCAWVPAKSYNRDMVETIVANNDNVYCGEAADEIFDQFEFLNHKTCCHGEKWDNCGDSAIGFPSKLGGPAEDDVIEFAASESSWLGVFLPAWKIATGNGQTLTPLKRLNGPCKNRCLKNTKKWKRKCR